MWTFGQRFLAIGLVLMASCSGVRGSSLATGGEHAPYSGPVSLVTLDEPTGREQVGLVEVSGLPRIAELTDEFRRHTAKVGGSVGKIDSIRTTFRIETRQEQESYSCGTSTSPRTCYRSVSRQVEVAETTLVGRAFR